MTVNEAIKALTSLKKQGHGDLPIIVAAGMTIGRFQTCGLHEEGQDFIPTSIVFNRQHAKDVPDRHN